MYRQTNKNNQQVQVSMSGQPRKKNSDKQTKTNSTYRSAHPANQEKNSDKQTKIHTGTSTTKKMYKQTNKNKQQVQVGVSDQPQKKNCDKQTKTIKVQFNNLAVAAKCSIQ
jgi:hypothetical protein